MMIYIMIISSLNDLTVVSDWEYVSVRWKDLRPHKVQEWRAQGRWEIPGIEEMIDIYIEQEEEEEGEEKMYFYLLEIALQLFVEPSSKKQYEPVPSIHFTIGEHKIADNSSWPFVHPFSWIYSRYWESHFAAIWACSCPVKERMNNIEEPYISTWWNSKTIKIVPIWYDTL